MMKVAIDCGPLTSGHSVRGVGAYTRELIKGLEKLSKDKKEIKIVPLDFSTRNSKLETRNFDLVHYTSFNPYSLSLPVRKYIKTIITIHDLIPLIYPKNYAPGIRGKFRFILQKHLIKNVDGVIAPSETSKKDIVRFLSIPVEKIRVISEAPRNIFKPLTNHKTLNSVKRKYNLPSHFTLYVGDVNYNKNVLGLIQACKIARTPLVICGKQAKDIEELGLGLDVMRGPMDWFRFLFGIPHPEMAHFAGTLDMFRSNKLLKRLGFVPDNDLVAIYNLASVYCQASFYEGFGLPVLEAMACGVPVVCSKTQSLVEIAGDAALFAGPKNPRQMADKITEILKRKETRDKLVTKGLERVKKFSWEKTAKETIEYYKLIING